MKKLIFTCFVIISLTMVMSSCITTTQHQSGEAKQRIDELKNLQANAQVHHANNIHYLQSVQLYTRALEALKAKKYTSAIILANEGVTALSAIITGNNSSGIPGDGNTSNTLQQEAARRLNLLEQQLGENPLSTTDKDTLTQILEELKITNNLLK